MNDQTLPPAVQAVLQALTEAGQATAQEIADRTGKARSTTDRHIKTLSEAGLISPVEGEDATEGAPTTWTLATPAASTEAQPEASAAEGEGDALAEADSATLASAAPQNDGRPGKDDDAGRAVVVEPSRPGDRKVMAIKAVLSDYGDEGVTLNVVSRESGIGPATVSRLLAAMEQADAARRITTDDDTEAGQRWIAGPTKASEVDPNPAPPRCSACGQVIRRQRPSTATGNDDATLNTDGNRPFARGELEELTLKYLAERPGQRLSPQEIALGISAKLGGREVSGGAVRNNCTKAAGAGRILLVSESPQAFEYPIPPENPDSQRH